MNALHRSMVKAGGAAVLLLAGALLSACATVPTAPPGARSELAPSGKLRAAINFGNPVLAQKDPATWEGGRWFKRNFILTMGLGRYNLISCRDSRDWIRLGPYIT